MAVRTRTRTRKVEYKIDPDSDLIDITLIKPLQTKLSIKKIKQVEKWMNQDTKFQITAVFQNGFYYIANGHHRIYVAYQLGIEKVYVKHRTGDSTRLFRRQTPGYDHITVLDIVEHEEFQKYIKK